VAVTTSPRLTLQPTKNTQGPEFKVGITTSNVPLAAWRTLKMQTFRDLTFKRTGGAGNMTTLQQAPHHTILFNIAAYTLIGLTPEDKHKVYAEIESTMNGDGLYEGASKETILQAYHDLQMGDVYGLNWVNHISTILEELNLIKPYIKAYKP
jgi:hypothetical protein